jgi:hypothetical protein
MNTQHALLIIAATLGIAAVTSAQAYDGDWKRGRVYYRQVCTSCHQTMAGKAISPNEKTKAEWTVYLGADKHDATKKSNPSTKYYVSRAYRDSIKASNKAAEKFLDVPDTELQADIKAFVIYGAKDSDNPSRCQ